jgi:PAS domain S-box-containing protein
MMTHNPSRFFSPMNETILVNFHCHSLFSDGDQTPEVLAADLAANGVRYAALTDHDSIEGYQRFQDALKKRGVTGFPGLELTTQFQGREIHLLCYGFDPNHPDLVTTLVSMRQARNLEVHSIADSIRKMGNTTLNGYSDQPVINAAPRGILKASDAIDLVHKAGGKVFLAHPYFYETDSDNLDEFLAALKKLGLDGLEAIYAPYFNDKREILRQFANKYDLLISAGTDFHTLNDSSLVGYGIEILREDWDHFRKALFAGGTFDIEMGNDRQLISSGEQSNSRVKPHQFRKRSYLIRIFLPTLFAITLFLAVIWGIMLPSFEETLLDRKKELIHELTSSAWSILASYEQDERNGLLTREQAQSMAVTRIEALRYGPEGKDYFWIQDQEPRMIMHPYRSDLNGQDLRSFSDPRGVAIFVEFAELVRRQGEGYIEYVWQWKDDPDRLEPKESFVKGFEPWGWVIGTGIYTDDVNDEIARIEQSLINTSLAISGIVVVLLLFVLQQSLKIEYERQEILDELRESTERYHTLIEATTEGTLLFVDERFRYANPTFLNMTGYTTRQLEFLDISDLLPKEMENNAIWERFKRMTGEEPVVEEVFEGFLKKADGSHLECVLSLNPIQFAGQRGFILLARDIARSTEIAAEQGVIHAAQAAPIGIFRARAARRAVFIEMNQEVRSLLANIKHDQPALADLFLDPDEFDEFYQNLQSNRVVKNITTHIEEKDLSTRILSISAQLVEDSIDHTSYIDGVIEDVTITRKQETAREALIQKLQASLLFLHEPIASLGRDALVCNMNISIEQVARQMTVRKVTAALVSSGSETIIGIVTDHDLRERVLAEKVQISAPIHTIMSAPLTKISEQALIYEALLRMEEFGVRHLAVEDRNGRIVSVIDNKSLVQFQRYGPIVINREIARAATTEEVALCTKRAPALIKTLIDSSTRPRHVTYLLASICDAVTIRLVELAIEELGPPPVAFAFIAMGSQGRQEQTLVTDQDNGIIYSNSSDENSAAVSDYFLKMGKRVSEGLDLAGYPYCRGGVMASNPRWCRSLSEWLSGFQDWVSKSEPQEIIDLSIFFDLRTIYGDENLTRELRRVIHVTVADDPGFIHHFAKNAIGFKPPMRLPGNIYVGGGSTEHAGEINLKDAMAPMVNFARLYALRYQVIQTHTLERIEALCERNLIQTASRDEMIAAYDFLMQLRLQSQVEAIQAGKHPQNNIHPGKLGYIQQESMKQAFAQISAVQKKIGYDFLGGGI